jgi:predicted alpha/beta superfamily hydrolase
MRKDAPKQIGKFTLYNKRPNTISKGSLYIAEIAINTQNEDKIRKIRVYLPSNYDFNDSNKRFDVLFMMDGKNCFDDYTSFVGEWHADEHLENDIIHKNP